MPTDLRAVTPSSVSAFASPKIIVPPTVELSGRRRVANGYGDGLLAIVQQAA